MKRDERFEAARKVILEHPDWSILRLVKESGMKDWLLRRTKKMLVKDGEIEDIPYVCANGSVSCHFPLEKRFWVKVNKTDSCWFWTSTLDPNGYGKFGINGKGEFAHRVAWELTNGPIPEGLCVLHNCPDGDNPRCVNPDHLWLGTKKDNSDDASKKGRLIGHQGRKLTEDDVREIRRLNADGVSYRKLARTFDVTYETISGVMSGRVYNWVE